MSEQKELNELIDEYVCLIKEYEDLAGYNSPFLVKAMQYNTEYRDEVLFAIKQIVPSFCFSGFNSIEGII